MARRVLRYTLIRRNPDTLEATALLAGEKVPAWAKDLVHQDDLVSADGEDDDSGSDGSGSDGDAGGDGSDGAKGVDDMTVAELKAEIDRRNEGRDDDAKVAKTGNKEELAAALKADDAAQA